MIKGSFFFTYKMRKFLMTISDDYDKYITDYTNIRIDDEGVVWYEFSYENGAFGEDEPVGVIKEIK